MASAESADALTVGGSIFELEKWLHNNIRVQSLRLPMYGRAAIEGERLISALMDTVVYVLTETTQITIGRPSERLKRLRKAVPPTKANYVCLFSGGVDSLSGLMQARRDLEGVDGAFCAHADQSRIIRVVNELSRRAFGDKLNVFQKIAVPAIGKRGYAQLRGFLYCLAAAAWMHLCDATTLIVTECGPTMYQPQFSALDAVTMTTHPVVLQQAKAAIEIVLRRKISLVTPFENLTKAEVMASCPRPDLFPWTHSCISQRFGEHDGTCFGCVVRRLAALAAGVADVEYLRDPISDDDANGGNLMSLLTYSHDLLLRYDHMEEFEIQKIERYKKQDLFRRFALDNFAALHRLVQKRAAMRASVRALYDHVVAVLGRSVLQARLKELERFSVVVNWDNESPK
jgi:hypothetical protein